MAVFLVRYELRESSEKIFPWIMSRQKASTYAADLPAVEYYNLGEEVDLIDKQEPGNPCSREGFSKSD